MAREDTQFKPGNKLGGRKTGGRRRCLDALDEMLAKSENIETFKKKLQSEFDKDPLKFWKEYAIPVMPRNLELSGPDGGPMEHVLTDYQLMKIAKGDDSA